MRKDSHAPTQIHSNQNKDIGIHVMLIKQTNLPALSYVTVRERKIQHLCCRQI